MRSDIYIRKLPRPLCWRINIKCWWGETGNRCFISLDTDCFLALGRLIRSYKCKIFSQTLGGPSVVDMLANIRERHLLSFSFSCLITSLRNSTAMASPSAQTPCTVHTLTLWDRRTGWPPSQSTNHRLKCRFFLQIGPWKTWGTAASWFFGGIVIFTVYSFWCFFFAFVSAGRCIFKEVRFV